MDFEQTPSRILCCMCGVLIESNPANMCVNCIRNQVDITEGIPKQLTINFCRGCGRYLQPPTYWLTAQLESKELLTLCIKKVKGLSRVKLVDASFVWTEPHSRRIKVKLTIQKEVFTSTILQQSFVIEYIVHPLQCPDCTKSETTEPGWIAVVQLRQKVDHKRTFYFLEQLILKHNAHTNTSGIKEMPEGLDFYFNHRSHALKFIDFLQAVVPIRFKQSEKLISHDDKSNVYSYKYSFSVEITPVCREDLVCLPKSLANSMGNICPLLLVHKISNVLHLVDPMTLQASEIQSPMYWKFMFYSLCGHRQLVNFVILDVVPLGPTRGKFAIADVQCAKESDFGSNDIIYTTRTHLGALLKPGDIAYGYDLANANTNDEEYDKVKRQNRNNLPEIVLVKKAYPNRRKKNKSRNWRLKDLPKEQEFIRKKAEESKAAQDYETFLQEIEEDPELRSKINLYKAGNTPSVAPVDHSMDVDGEEEEEDFPEVRLDELLDGLTLQDDDENWE